MSPCEREQVSTNVLRMDCKLGQNEPIEPPAPRVRLPQGQHAFDSCQRRGQVIAVLPPNRRAIQRQIGVVEVVGRRDRRLDHAAT